MGSSGWVSSDVAPYITPTRPPSGQAKPRAFSSPGSSDGAYAVKILPCELSDLEHAWQYFQRSDLHKLSAVDATSFVIMKRMGIRIAYAFDRHFAMAGFRLVG